jgi:hypothetical protein
VKSVERKIRKNALAVISTGSDDDDHTAPEGKRLDE